MLALLLASIIPVELVAEDHVTVAELNHFYDEQGRLVFDQLVLWDFRPCLEREECVAWRMVKHSSMKPEYDHDRGLWVATFQDGEITRRVLADSFRESWTQHDVEVEARAYLPKDCRRELRKELAR